MKWIPNHQCFIIHIKVNMHLFSIILVNKKSNSRPLNKQTAVKYTSEENSKLSRINKLHFNFFAIVCSIMHHLNIWKNEKIRKGIEIEMKMHGLIDDELHNTIDFGLKLTQSQIFHLIDSSPWLHSETESTKSTRWNAALSLVMYSRKAFDADSCVSLQINQYLKIMADLLGLSEAETKYINLLYETEKNLVNIYRYYL